MWENWRIKDHAKGVTWVYCSFRKSKVLGIYIEDVDLRRGSIRVNHTVQITKKGVYIDQAKTESSRRTVTVPRTALVELREYVGRLNRNQGLLFLTANNCPVSPPNVEVRILCPQPIGLSSRESLFFEGSNSHREGDILT
jgi:integrase